MKASPAPPAPIVFKTMGYVEKAGGQLEAIILQDNQVQVVHIGDLIAGKFRVTKVSADVVDAVDETLVKSSMATPEGANSNETANAAPLPSASPATMASGRGHDEVSAVAAKTNQPANIPDAGSASAMPAVAAQAPPPSGVGPAADARIAPPQSDEPVAESLGYVERADGKVVAVVADGDTVRLVPETPAAAMAQVSPAPHPQKVEAVVADGDTGRLVPQSAAVAMTQIAPNSDQQEASAAQVSSASSETASLLGPEASDSLAEAGGNAAAPLASIVRQASYQVPTSVGGDNLSVDGELGPIGEVAGGPGGASGPLASTVAGTPGDSTVRSAKMTVTLKPIGYVVKADGEFDAILSEDDEIYIVRQGERFAGHYRAVRVSEDSLEAVEEPLRQGVSFFSTGPPEFPDLLTPSTQQGPLTPPPWGRKDAPTRSASAGGAQQGSAFALEENGTSREAATFVFQNLGYVEVQNGELQAIVVDGSQVYLVKQGETFGDQYLATSVDPILVLAVRVPPGQDEGNLVAAQTESGNKLASKKLYGHMQYPLFDWGNAQSLHEVDASGSPAVADFGANLLHPSLTGFAVTFFQGR